MATQIKINSVDYANPPAGSQTWTFEYKLFSDPGWTLASNSSVVNPDGTLVSPLTIPGLTPAGLYYVRSSANCSSPVDYYIQAIQL